MKLRLNRMATLALVLILSLAASPGASAAIMGPYTPDANTLHLYHFDEASGTFFDAGGGVAFDLTNTGGASGRSGTAAGAYGGAAYPGFGNSMNALGSGSGVFHTTKSPIGGGVTTGADVSQSGLQSAAGAFTWEALVYTGGSFTTAGERTILSHDGAFTSSGTPRGPMLRVIVDSSGNRTLNWYNGGVGQTLSANLPTTGDDAFAQDKWFHVAATYTGVEGATDNFKFYWTALDSGATEASLLQAFTQTADAFVSNNRFGVGAITRDVYRFEWEGLVDEVRISDIARGADDFLFAEVPEPTTIATWSLLGGALLGFAGLQSYRRKRA